jgi:Ca-activated chloride channel family protein
MIAIVDAFHFLRPAWLWCTVPALLLAAALWRSRDRDGNWSRVVAPELLEHLLGGDRRRRGNVVAAIVACWLLATLAAAGPSWQRLPQPVLQKQDALVVAVDLSYSMLATDLAPSRNDRVQRKLRDLLSARREGLTALIAYAGDAHVVAPLTDDTRTIANLVPALEPAIMPLPGSDPVDAVQRAVDLLASGGIRRGRILLISDGIEDRDAQEIAELVQDAGHRLAVLGVGTGVGAPIPLPGGGFLKDDAGNIVVPALDEEPLRDLATRSGGTYAALTVDDSDLARLFDATLTLSDDTITRDRRADQWQDAGHWLLLPLLLAALLGFRRGAVYGLALVAVLAPPESHAAQWMDLWLRADQQGAEALRSGDAERAAQLFADPAWRGTAAWENGDYAAALEAFRDLDSADGWYNRGNALAAAGDIEQALAAYRRSLELEAGREDALANIETLERLRQQQEQQQSSPQDPGQSGAPQEQPEQGAPQGQEQGEEHGDEQADPAETGGDGAEQPRGSEEARDPAQPPAQGEQARDAPEGQGDSRGAGEDRDAPMPTPSIDNSAMQEAMERDQALEQWLRRVPDDPSGLLREKFRYESRRRQQQGEQRGTDKIW